MFLFFDTETTGVPRNYRAPVTDLGNWPRMVQLAWLECDGDGAEITSYEFIIRPDGYRIPSEVSRIHGITHARAVAEGVALTKVVAKFLEAVEPASLLVAHNMGFDEKVVGAELLRQRRPNVLETKSRLCTMVASTEYCRLPGRYGCKWPTLSELHRVLFQKSFKESHTALADVRACAKCFFELRRLGVITAVAAANRPRASRPRLNSR